MNPINLIPPQYRILAAVGLVAAVFVGGLWLGHEWRDRACDLTISDIQRGAEKAAREASEAARAKEKGLLKQITDIEAQRHEEDKTAEAERDRLLADIRAGQLRLRDRFTCPEHVPGAATGTGGGDAGTEGGLRREDAEFFISIAAEADQVTRQLQACQSILRSEREQSAP